MSRIKESRRREILDVTADLYKTMDYRDITFNAIGCVVSMSRPSIYNYFETKEEIFLTLLTEEYNQWAQELEESVEQVVTEEELARLLSTSLQHREGLLKLMSNNLNDLEAHSRQEFMVAYKQSYGTVVNAVKMLLFKCVNRWCATQQQRFIDAFFPFLYGAYAYSISMEKQQECTVHTGEVYEQTPLYRLVYNFLEQLFRLPSIHN